MAHTRIALPPHFPVVPAQPIDPFDTLEASPPRTRPPRSVGDILLHRRWLIIGFTAAVVTAVMAWSSRPRPLMGLPDVVRAVSSTPARPAMVPQMTYIVIRSRRRSTPARRAAVALPPTA